MSTESTGLSHGKYCKDCGNNISISAISCPRCGGIQDRNITGQKDRVTAAVLALILGWFGVHKFYLGQIGMGIIYLLFSFTLIPGLIGIIEGLIYLSMSNEEFTKKYP